MTLVESGAVSENEKQAAERQWRAERLQMVNWGGFDGYHPVEFATTATLISGSSGTGKSTLLDAYIALMMDSTVPFNGASNDSVTGRARSSEQRNVLSYVRGKVDTSRQSGTGQLQDEVLRGRDSSTWSAVAMTWRSDRAEHITALRIYFAPASAQQFADITMHMAIVTRAFDLRDLEEFAADRFLRQRMSARIPDISFYDSYRTFAAALHTRLGIGAGGDGSRALKLLARIQGGRQVTTVDGLYKTMVLEEPRTFAVADRAINHFDDLQASYQTMKNAELQVRILENIPESYEAHVTAEREAALIDTYRVSSDQPDTPFAYWALLQRAALLEAAVDLNRAARQSTGEERLQHGRTLVTLRSQLADLVEELRANGGDAVDSLQRTLEALLQGLEETRANRIRFESRTEILQKNISNKAQFDELTTESEAFLAIFAQRQSGIDERIGRLGADTRLTSAHDEELGREQDSLRGRDGLIPHELHVTRLSVARALGLEPSALPFVGELVDMDPRYENWREAAELALGGFAVTMLVDERRLGDVRREINSMRMRRRISFEGADTAQMAPETLSEDHLPGRFVSADNPLTGWLLNRLGERFNYNCVSSSAELDEVSLGLTITGQTKQRRRGAHGGHGAPRVLGFSNAGRLAEIEVEREQLAVQLIGLKRELTTLSEERGELTRIRDAHRDVLDLSWASIDVNAVEDDIRDKQQKLSQILQSNDKLSDLKQQEAELAKQVGDLDYRVRQLDETQKELDHEHGESVTQQDRVHTRLWEMEEANTTSLSDAQHERLDQEFASIDPEPSLDRLSRILDQLKGRLLSQSAQARKDADNAARTLKTTFERFQDKWQQPNLGIEVDSYSGYLEILQELLAEGLHERQERWSHQVNDWTGQELLALNGAYSDSIDEIESRLIPVNEILGRQPFGPGKDCLFITLRRTEGKDISEFRKELRFLSSGTTSVLDYAQAEARYRRLQRFIERIRRSNKSSEREYLIDVRRHVHIEAERRDITGRQLGVYTSLGGKSGGETQELVAFIVGAALRYQLGDADASRPSYAPVFLDEGFVKSDSEFAGRAVSAWRGLGFQLIIGAPNDKVTAIEPYMDLLLQVTKNSKNHSYVSDITPTTLAPAVDALL
jgi:uncharacterized protein YPO0396